MSFLAQCPYCNRKVRVPDNAAGWSLECRKCGSSFTVVAVTDLPEPDDPPPVDRTPAPPATAVAAPPPAPPPVETVPTPARPVAAPMVPYVPASRSALERRLGLTPLASAALCCGCVALLAASLAPSIAWAVGLGTLGLVLGGLGLVRGLALGQGPAGWSAGAAALNLVLLGVCLLRPDLLGARPLEWPWRSAPDTARTVHIPIGSGALATPGAVGEGEWVDAGKEGVQQGDVRVRLLSAAVRPIEVRGPDGSPRLSKEKYLVLRLRLQNLGFTRKVEFDSWAAPATAERPAPTLKDNQGKNYRLKPAPGATAPGRVPLAPSKTVEDLLLFEAPPATVEYLRLELPAEAFGGSGPLRLQLPRALIAFAR